MSLEKLSQRLLTADSHNKTTDKIAVSFLKMPDNFSDFLGSRVSSVSYPSFSTSVMTHRRRKTPFHDAGYIEGGEVSMSFLMDTDALVEMLLFVQYYRQHGAIDDAWGKAPPYHDYKFDTEVIHYNISNEEVKRDTFVNCFISNIEYPEMSFSDDADQTPILTATLQYDKIIMKQMDYFIELKFG